MPKKLTAVSLKMANQITPFNDVGMTSNRDRGQAFRIDIFYRLSGIEASISGGKDHSILRLREK